ncbi:MAG: 5-oxoprolinase subunit PxpB [Firmicutes bacterium]|nr:5-oxoprolinase subunit PxpB [Bacillota bacterium]
MNKYKITLVDAGDSAVSIRFPQEISEKVHNEVMHHLGCIRSAVTSEKLPGILDIVPSYAAILICFDISVTNGETIKDSLEEIILSNPSSENREFEKRVIEIPVVYGGEYGPDLETVATHTGLSTDEVIRLHSEPEYPVYMIGFLAGFPYLGGLNPALETPRLESPRLSVPAGSVGIADKQTGIYPVESPGGWQIIGRTDTKLYDPNSDNPFLVSAGDVIKFVPAEPDSIKSVPSNHKCDNESKQHVDPALRILSPGPLTTIQDLGRHGYMDKGISVCGAMDCQALSELNLMLGNHPDAAGLESTFITPRIEFLKDTVFAVSGIHHPIKAKAGDILESITMSTGIRTYFAFAGGIDVPIVLGSRSTDIKNRIGGLEGRKLGTGDELALYDQESNIHESAEKVLDTKESLFTSSTIELNAIAVNVNSNTPSHTPLHSTENPVTIHITTGPQYSDLSESGISTFLNSEYIVSTSSDRMGIRFDGPSLSFTEEKDGNIITDGLCPGAIQVTPSGQPILMNADCQTTGGYAKPFWLASISKRKVAQLRPGDRVRFVLIKTADAVSLFRESL